MCHFVPGQVLALGPLGALNEIARDLPGDLEIKPLVTEGVDLRIDSELARLGTAILHTDVGVELFALSRLSAALASAIKKGDAVADLNHLLPLAGSELSSPSIRLSPRAEEEALAVRRLLRRELRDNPVRSCVAVLDSGLSPTYRAHRTSRYFDYSDRGRFVPNRPLADPLGHGTQVVKILDHVLPLEVELAVGRLPSDPDALTILTVAHAFGDLVARTTPDVVNLSVAPRNDVFSCSACRARSAMPTFLSSVFPLLMRVAGRGSPRTITVMASGNSGQVPNSRWLASEMDPLVLAVAENQWGERARYSSAPEGPLADLHAAGAFGGDDPEDPGAQGVFTDGTRGTSFAAPFVSAVALAVKRRDERVPNGSPAPLAPRIHDWIDMARNTPSLRRRLMIETGRSRPVP